jgi:tetratricopeptide (TPR) repeat protein
MRAMGRVEEALDIQRELEAADHLDGFTEEEIAECLHALGRAGEAQPHFKAAYEKLSQIDWVAEDEERLARLKLLSSSPS